ncbi:uncharacterized protein LOC111255822 [Setaria italica]|uniref:uncharacterized protein LOC111255822 n=1 Tax=Setaria italica TaxID=4555 RepID=UPI000BE566D5|nr:uncharacterized protein LOC111255822 [Setaria italica]
MPSPPHRRVDIVLLEESGENNSSPGGNSAASPLPAFHPFYHAPCTKDGRAAWSSSASLAAAQRRASLPPWTTGEFPTCTTSGTAPSTASSPLHDLREMMGQKSTAIPPSPSPSVTPSMSWTQPDPVSRCGFQALTRDTPKDDATGKLGWGWHRLRPPPFVLEPGYRTTRIDGYTVVGGSAIWVSTPGIDTVRGSWSKAGDWELPFQGRADLFPEYGAWLGFSSRDGRICCSSGLEAMAQRAPGLDAVWDGLHLPGKWTPLKSRLVQLGPGGGKFCLAILYERIDNEVFDQVTIPQVERCAVFTGLVLKRGGSDGMGLEMTKHKSRIYRFQGGTTTGWVF